MSDASWMESPRIIELPRHVSSTALLLTLALHTSTYIVMHALSITLIVVLVRSSMLLRLFQYRLHHLIPQPGCLRESWRKVLLDPLESVPVGFEIAK